MTTVAVPRVRARLFATDVIITTIAIAAPLPTAGPRTTGPRTTGTGTTGAGLIAITATVIEATAVRSVARPDRISGTSAGLGKDVRLSEGRDPRSRMAEVTDSAGSGPALHQGRASAGAVGNIPVLIGSAGSSDRTVIDGWDRGQDRLSADTMIAPGRITESRHGGRTTPRGMVHADRSKVGIGDPMGCSIKVTPGGGRGRLPAMPQGTTPTGGLRPDTVQASAGRDRSASVPMVSRGTVVPWSGWRTGGQRATAIAVTTVAVRRGRLEARGRAIAPPGWIDRAMVTATGLAPGRTDGGMRIEARSGVPKERTGRPVPIKRETKEPFSPRSSVWKDGSTTTRVAETSANVAIRALRGLAGAPDQV